MDDARVVNGPQRASELSGNGDDMAFRCLVSGRTAKGREAPTGTVLADDPKLRMHLESLNELVDVHGLALLEALEYTDLLESVFHTAIFIGAFGAKVHGVGLQNLDCHNFAGRFLLTASELARRLSNLNVAYAFSRANMCRGRLINMA